MSDEQVKARNFLDRWAAWLDPRLPNHSFSAASQMDSETMRVIGQSLLQYLEAEAIYHHTEWKEWDSPEEPV